MSCISGSDGKKPIEKPNNDLSEAMEQLSVTAPDFDKNSPSLSDMPLDVVGLIIEKLDYRQHLKLRKVSKSLREFVDKQKPACKSITVVFWYGEVVIGFDNHWVVYTDGESEGEEIIVIRDDYVEAALEDLADTLENPKLQLEELEFTYSIGGKESLDKYWNEFQNVLESLNHQVSVKRISLDVFNSSNLLSILPFLKPCVLKTITLRLELLIEDESINPFNPINIFIPITPMDRIARLEQWKQAEKLELQYGFDRFPMEYATHFKRFYIIEDRINGGTFIRIMKYLSQLDNFEHCTLACEQFKYSRDLVQQLLGAPVSSNTTEEVFHRSIPNSDYYFEFKKGEESYEVRIEKKKREDN